MMKTTSLRARALACALLTGTALCGLAAAPASAQTAREHRALDSNGVDLTHGDFVMAFVEGTIGSGDGALALVRSKVPRNVGLGSGGHQWDGIYLSRSVGFAGTSYLVDKDSRYERFTAFGTLPTGTSLEASGAQYHYRTSDGTLIVFGDPTGSTDATSTYCNGSSGQGGCTALPLTITSPDGKAVGLQWNVWRSCEDILIEPGDLPKCSYWTRLAGVSNSFGYRIAFDYETDGEGGVGDEPPPVSWEHREGAALYNNLVSTTVPQATTAYSYPSTGVVDVTDTGGRQWRFTDGAFGIAGIRRPGAGSDTTTVTRSGANISSVTRDGVTTNYARSVSGTTAEMIVTQVIPGGTSPVSKVYSDLTKGRPTSVVDPLSHTTSFTYDSSNRLTRVTAHDGNYVEHTYDARGNITQTVAVPKSGSGPTIVTSASFDSTCANPVTCNRLNSTTDARGNVTDYTYDPTHGGVLTITAPAVGGVRPQTRYSYTQLTNGDYQLTGVSQCRTVSACTGTADEVKTALAYDPNGNLYWTATGDGTGTLRAETTMTYDPVGNLKAVDGPLPTDVDIHRTDYNGARQPTMSVSPDPDGSGALKPRAIRRTYNSAGLLEKVEQGNVDSLSDPTWATFSAAQAVERIYDANARPIVSKLVSGSTVHALSQTRYDALGRPDCSVQRMDTADFGSSLPDACAQTSPAGPAGPDRISAVTYDLAGRVTKVTSAIGTADAADETVTTYRPNGQVESVTDGENNKTTYEYDGHDRLVKTYYPTPSPKGAGTSNAADYEQLTYESLAGGAQTSNLVVAYRNRDNQTAAFTYDALGRQVSKDLPGSEPTVTYGYDLLGRLTSASRTGHALGFTYDALGRVLNQTSPLGTVASEYDIAGRRTKLTWPDSFNVTYDYLVTGENTAIRENGAASGIGVLATLAYDDLGRRTSLTLGNGVATNYTYDPVSRLGELKLELPGTTDDLTSTFAYNPASQIASNLRSNDAYSWTGHGSGTTVATSNGVAQSANGLNQIGSWVSTLGYDAKGNLTSDGTYTYGYSSENLLTSLANSAPGAVQPTIAFAYDPLMRLSVIDSASSMFDIEFGYDGQEMIIEALSGGRTRRYVHGPGVDEPLVAYLVTPGVGTSRVWYQADERGSIARHSLDSGAPTSAIGKYDEYGVGGTGRYRYTGQYWLGEANLLYYRARVYDARLGRFLQPDPIGYGDGMNMYAYVGGDPVNFRDPSGLCVSTTMGRFSHNEDWSESVLLYSWVEIDGCGGGFGGGFGGGWLDGGGGSGGSPQEDTKCKLGGGKIDLSYDGTTLNITAKITLIGPGADTSSAYIAGIGTAWTRSDGPIKSIANLSAGPGGVIADISSGILPPGGPRSVLRGSYMWLGNLGAMNDRQIAYATQHTAAHEFGHSLGVDNMPPIGKWKGAIMANSANKVSQTDLEAVIEECRAAE